MYFNYCQQLSVLHNIYFSWLRNIKGGLLGMKSTFFRWRSKVWNWLCINFIFDGRRFRGNDIYHAVLLAAKNIRQDESFVYYGVCKLFTWVNCFAQWYVVPHLHLGIFSEFFRFLGILKLREFSFSHNWVLLCYKLYPFLQRKASRAFYISITWVGQDYSALMNYTISEFRSLFRASNLSFLKNSKSLKPSRK